MTTYRFALHTLLLLSLAPSVSAFGALGHQLVGRLAERELTPAAHAEVATLLAGEVDPTLGGVAVWADTMRSDDPDRFRATSAWHYVNTPPGTCTFDAARDCKDDACVIRSIEAQKAILADRKQSPLARKEALKFLVHFVGDIHQPLHASNRDDLGGNRFQISLRTDIEPEAYARKHFVDGIMGTNLHSIWDFYVLASARTNLDAYAERLAAEPPIEDHVTSAEAWAAESCGLIAELDLYPDGHKMDHTYLDEFRPHAEQRVRVAGHRLAVMLNGLLSAP